MRKAFALFFALSMIITNIFCENPGVIKKNLAGKTYKQQTALLEKYIASENRNIDLYKLKAEIEIKNMDFTKADMTLKTALLIDPANARILNLKGLCLFHMNKTDEAVKYFKKALDMDKNDRFALFYLSLADPLGNYGDYADKANSTGIDIKELISKYGETDDGKNQDYEYLLNKRSVNIKDGKTMSYSVHCVVRIFSNQGVNVFRNFQFSFNSFEFAPEVIKAGSYNADLGFNEVNRKNIVVVDKKDDGNNSVYSNLKYIAFPMPDLSIGSVIEYEILFNPTGKNLSTNIFDQYVFGGFDKTGLSQYTVRYPSDLKIHFHKNTADIIESESSGSGFMEKIFIYENPPVFDLEGETVTIFDVAPMVTLGTFRDWESISKWYSEIFERNIKTGLNPNDVKKIAAPGKTKFETMNSVYQYVQKNIHYIAVELAESAMIPHTPYEIHKNKFGDCKDQVTLLTYLLRVNGIESYPVLVSTGGNGRVEKSVPSPYYFNHLVTYVPKQDGIEKEFYLDTTSSFTAIGCLPSPDQGAAGFIIKKDGSGAFTTLPVASYEDNLIEEDYVLDTNIAGGGKINLIIKNKGAFSENIRALLAGRSENEIREYFYNSNKKTFLNLKKNDISVSGADTRSGDLSIRLESEENSLTNVFFDGRLKINFKIKEIGTFVKLPRNPHYDIIQNFQFTYKKNIEYKFPKNYAVTDGEIKNIKKENEYMSYEFYADKIADNHLKFSFVFIFKKRDIKKTDAGIITAFISEIENNINFELTLENRKNFDETGFYEELLKAYNQKEIYQNYVRKLLEKRNFDKALEICKTGRESFSNDAFFHIVESTILTDRGNYAQAESLLIDAMDIDDNNPDIYSYLSEVYRQSNEDAKLEKLLVAGNEKFKNNNLIQSLITFYKRKEMHDKGIEFVKELTIKEPSNSSFFGELGYFYSLKKEIAKAEEMFLKSVELNPKNSQSLNNLAWLYCENTMKINEAIRYAKKACELEPYSDSYLDTLAEAYFLNKSYDLAIETIQKAIKINPNYTYLKQQLDKIEKAKRMMEKK